MLQSAISAVESVANAVPKGGVEVAHVAGPSNVGQVAQPQASDVSDFTQDISGVSGATDVRPNIVEFHNASISTSSPLGQDMSDRLGALSQQLQPQTAIPLEARPMSATAGVGGHDDMTSRVKSAVGDMKQTYSYIVTTSFVSHIGSQFMQVFNTLLKGQ